MTPKSGNNAGNYLLGLVPAGSVPKTFFASYILTAGDATTLRAAAQDDARRYVYNAAVSFLGALAGLHVQHSAWAVTKLYYTAFYVGRAALCRSSHVIFHVPRGKPGSYTQYEIHARPGWQATVVDDLPSTHKLVAARFKQVGYPAFMQSLVIDGRDPVVWLMELREYWQYRAGRFSDPDMPDVLEHIDPAKAPRLLEEYAADKTGAYLADRAHAIVSVPFRLLAWALGEDRLLSTGVVDLEDIGYLRRRCRIGGLKLGAIDRYLSVT